MEIKGTEGYVLVYAKCCCPLPGDPIEGFLSPDRGLVVHRRTAETSTIYASSQSANAVTMGRSDRGHLPRCFEN